MSKTFGKPGGTRWSKPLTPARFRLDSFKIGKENMQGPDYNTGWRQYTSWRARVSHEFRPGGLAVLQKNPRLHTKQLRNPAAREIQRGRIERFEPETAIDPANPFRPLEHWVEPILSDEYQTQYHEKYEYPYMTRDPWTLKTKKQTRPTGAYYRPPDARNWLDRGYEHPHDQSPEFEPLTYCILRADVSGLGAKGDVVAVDCEQFRIDLHPNRAAVVATRENCDLLGVPYDPVYQDYDRRDQHAKLMHRKPWVWDQLQGMPWDQFTRPAASADTERDQPWDGTVEEPIFAAEMIARRKEEAAEKRAEKQAQEAKDKERKQGAAQQMFTFD